MNNLPKRTPLATPMRPTPESILQDKDKNWKDAETAIEELKSIELIPLVMDIVNSASTGTLKAQDVENAAGPIKVRVNKARDILKNIHGLAETPEERSKRVERLKRNIEVKGKSLQRFKTLVAKRITVSQENETTNSETLDHITDSNLTAISDPTQQDIQKPVELKSVPQFTTTATDGQPQVEQTASDDGSSDVEMIDESEFNAPVPESDAGIDISNIGNIENIDNAGYDGDIQLP